MMTPPIYLDYAATTPLDPRVAESMMACLTREGNFGNPASRSHFYGWKAEEAVELARKQVAEVLKADSREIVWTSGATESNNLALKGALVYSEGLCPHIIVSAIEHKSVLDVAAYLAEHGVEVSYVQPDKDGVIHLAAIEALVNSRTQLVSVMHVNNETGVINPVAQIGAWCREQGILFHVDAAQSFGKMPIDVTQSNIDLLSLSAHKIYGPKGVGALYVRRSNDVDVKAQMHGGGHERGMRSGTLATHQVVGLGKAAEIASLEMDAHKKHAEQLAKQFSAGLARVSAAHINGSLEQRLPSTFNVSFDGVDGEALLMSLRELAISSGSACMSATLAPSYVLKAMGLSDMGAQSALRFSFGRYTTEADVETALQKIDAALAVLAPQSTA